MSRSPHRRLSETDPDWDEDGTGAAGNASDGGQDDNDSPRHPALLGSSDALSRGASSAGMAPKTPHRRKTTILPQDAPLLPSGMIARALFDFQDQDAGDELNFSQGDLIEVLETLDDGWCVGRDSKGKVGMFPANFVEETMQVGFEPLDQVRRESTKPAPTPRLNKRKQSLFQRSSAESGDDLGESMADAALAAAEGAELSEQVVDIVRALYDIDEQPEGDELILKEGDLVEVYQKFEDGWWYGGIGGRKGYFPSNCVEVGVRVDHDDLDSPGPFGQGNRKQEGIAAGKVDIAIRSPDAMGEAGRTQSPAGVAVGSAVAAGDASSGTKGAIFAPPAPPPKNAKGVIHSSQPTVSTEGGRSNFVPEEDYTTRILILKAVASLSLLLAFSTLASGIFGPFAATADLEPYPLSDAQKLLPTAPFLETAEGKVTLSHGAYVGTTSSFKIVPGTPVNVSSRVAGAVGMLDFSAGGIVSFTHTITGLEPFTQYGLRIESEESCDVEYSTRSKNEASDPGKFSAQKRDDEKASRGRIAADIVIAWISTDAEGMASGTSMGPARDSRTVDSFHGHTLVVTDDSGRSAACATVGHTIDAAAKFENGGGPALMMSVNMAGLEPSAFPLSTGSESDVTDANRGLRKYPGYSGVVPSGKITVVQEKINQVATVVSRYPGYTGQRSPDVAGWVRIQNGVAGTSGQLTVEYSLFGLEPNTRGGLYVHRGTDCANSGGTYYDVVGAGQREDPWTAQKEWISDVHGHAAGAFTVIPGPDSLDVIGRTVVVHDITESPGNGNRLACGVLQNLNFARVSYDLTGLGEITTAPAGSEGQLLLEDTGVISIHQGKTCTGTNVQIGATFKNSEVLGEADPWRTEYVADRVGEASGSFVVAYGYSLSETRGRTIVVTDYNGQKVACGVLEDASRSSEEFAARRSVMGQISVHDGNLCGEETSSSYHGKLWAGVPDGVDPWSSVYYITDEFGHANQVMMVNPGLFVSSTLGRSLVVRDSAGTRVACGVLYAAGSTMHPALLENYATIAIYFSLVVICFVTLLVSTLHSYFVPVPAFQDSARRGIEHKIELAVFCVLLICQTMVSWSTFHSMDDESRMVKGKVGVIFFFLSLLSMLLVLVLGNASDKAGAYANAPHHHEDATRDDESAPALSTQGGAAV